MCKHGPWVELADENGFLAYLNPYLRVIRCTHCSEARLYKEQGDKWVRIHDVRVELENERSVKSLQGLSPAERSKEILANHGKADVISRSDG